MDSLLNIIDNRAQKKVETMPLIKTIPTLVVEVLENNMVTVQLLSEPMEYTVPNLCGSPVAVGEAVQLYYKGTVISDRSAYIGASSFKPSTNFVMANLKVGSLSNSERKIAEINFTAYYSKVSLVFNGVCENSSEYQKTGRLSIYLDDVIQPYRPQFTVVANGSYHLAFTLPYDVAIGEHKLTVKAIGIDLSLSAICAYITGYVNIYIPDYEPTDEDDYVWGTNDDGAEVYLYVGNSPSPEVIDELDGNSVNTLTCTSFNYSNVVAVYIPDGIERIE